MLYFQVKLEAKNKLNAQMNDPQSEQARQAFENKEITIKNLKEKIEDMQGQIDGKMSDIENNNSQLTDLKTQLTQLVNECENLYGSYEEKKTKVLEMKNSNKNIDYTTAWKDTPAWGEDNAQDSNWPSGGDDNWPAATTAHPETATVLGNACKFRALYEFVARNSDEVSFQPGDIINVSWGDSWIWICWDVLGV